MMRWWTWLAAVGLLAALAGCARSNDMARIEAIDAQMERDPAGAIQEAERYVAEYPESAVGWRVLGWARLRSDTDDEAARAAFERSLELDPKDDNSYVGLGAYYRRADDLDKASEMYAKAIELEPENPEAYSSMSGVDLLRRDFAAAVRNGEKAWELDSSNATIAANLSVAYHFNGEHEKRDELLASAERLGYANMQDLRDLFND